MLARESHGMHGNCNIHTRGGMGWGGEGRPGGGESGKVRSIAAHHLQSGNRLLLPLLLIPLPLLVHLLSMKYFLLPLFSQQTFTFLPYVGTEIE